MGKKDAPPKALPGEPLLKAVIYPDAKKVGCVLLQAIYGGNSTVPSLFFEGKQWATAPLPNPRPCSATPAQWRWLAKRWAAVVVVALLASGCAEMEPWKPGDPVRVRACDTCYYRNNSYSYHSLYFADGKVVLVEPWSKIDVEGRGSYTVNDGSKKRKR